MRVIFLEREANRDTGEVTVRYAEDAKDTSAEPLLFVLGKKQKECPEFQYFAMDREKYNANKDVVEELLGKAELPDRSTLLEHNIVHV